MPTAQQTNADLKGDLLSVKMFGAAGDGVADDRDSFQDALNYVGGKGGGIVRVPKTNSGFYLLNSPISIPSNVLLTGEGDGSLIKRGAAMPAGDGLILIDGTDAGIQDLKIDGDVTTITNLLYGVGTSSVLFNNDPMDSKLTLNTSIWIRPGAHNFWISGVTVTHTGGYSILVDVINGDTRNGAIHDCFFENNRPHLFGVDAGVPANNIYGAWTGGIFVKGDCTTAAAKLFAMRGLTVRGCKFHRMNGNCIWSHSNGFDTHHENFIFDQNSFRYIARDGYMIGNVEGGHAHGSMSYVGFTHTTDVDAPAGAYLAGNYAVGFDAAGYVSNFEFSGDVTEVYGGGFDLDGVRDSTILSPRVFSSQAIVKGIQTGDTNANGGGHNVRIIGGHLSGCNVGAVVLNQADGCLVTGVTIDHPTGASGVPILLYSLDLNTKNSVVTKNLIRYPDSAFCIAESDAGAGTGFDATTRNFVFDNICIGANKGEFYKDPNSASTTGYTFSTNVATPTNRSEFYMQREGQGTSAALKGYTINTSTQKQRFQWQDYRDGSTEDSLLNVSLAGAADTGVVALGDRTVFGFGDVFGGGHMLGYGFMGILGKTAAGSVYSDVRADLLTDIWALLRFDEATNTIQQSVSTSAGARVWTPISGTPGGSDTHVQFNDGGVFGGEAALIWDKTANLLTVTGTTGTAGIAVATAYIQSAEGFLTTSSASTAVNVQSGGVTALSLIAIRNDAADAWTISRTSATARQYGFSINASGELILSDATAVAARLKVTTGGTVQIGSTITNTQIDQSGNISIIGTLSGTGASGAVNVPTNTATNAIQAASGGVTAKYLVTTESIFGIAVAAPAVSAASQGKLHFNSTSNKWEYSENGSSWAAAFGVSTVAGANTQIQYNNSGAFGASADLTWTSGSKLLTVTGATGTASIVTVTSYIQSAEGFLTNDASSDAVNVPNGGVTALSLISIRNDGSHGLTLSRTSATARDFGFRVNTSGQLVIDDITGGTVPQIIIAPALGFIDVKDHRISTGSIEVGNNSSGNRAAFIDFHGDDTFTDYGLRVIRNSNGVNANSEFLHRGTGALNLDVVDSGSIGFLTASVSRMTISSAGLVTIGSTVAINQSGAITLSGVLTCNGASGGVNVSSNSAYNCIQASNSGGMAARSFTASVYIQTGQSAADPTATTSDTLNNGAMYYNTTSGKLRAKVGGAFVDVATGAAGGVTSLNSLTGALSITAGTGISVTPSSPNIAIANTGVTSATGTANQVTVSASTGAVTFSLPSSVTISGNFTFGSSSSLIQGSTTRIDTVGAATFTDVTSSGNVEFGSASNFTQGPTTVRIDPSGNAMFASLYIGSFSTIAIDGSRNTDFARMKATGQLWLAYTDDNAWAIGDGATVTTAKLAIYDTSGTFIGWVPIFP